MASRHCGWCGCLAHLEAATAPKLVTGEWGGFAVEAAYRCPNCHRLNIAWQSVDRNVQGDFRGTLDESDGWDWPAYSTTWLPRREDSRHFPDVPEHIALAATEATLCLSVGAYRAVGSLARAVIEATAKDKGITSGKLDKKIDALCDGHGLHQVLREQAHEVRYFGNDMAHGDFAEPVTDAEAEEIIDLMAKVLEGVYQAPAQLARRKEAREASKAAEKAGDQTTPGPRFRRPPTV